MAAHPFRFCQIKTSLFPGNFIAIRYKPEVLRYFYYLNYSKFQYESQFGREALKYISNLFNNLRNKQQIAAHGQIDFYREHII